MRNYITLTLILCVLALMQGVFPSVAIILLFSLLLVFLGREDLAATAVFIGGLLLDLLQPYHFGLFTLVGSLSIFVVLLARRIFPKNGLFYLLQTAVGVFLFNVLVHFMSLKAFSNLSQEFFGVVIKNALFIIILFPFSYLTYEIFKVSGVRRGI